MILCYYSATLEQLEGTSGKVCALACYHLLNINLPQKVECGIANEQQFSLNCERK